jgi:hypothetical protein
VPFSVVSDPDIRCRGCSESSVESSSADILMEAQFRDFPALR